MKFLNINNNIAFKQMPDGGVEYTGDSIPDLGIEKGDGLDKILSNLIGEVMSLRSTADGSNTANKVDELSNKIDNLSVDDLKTTAATFSVGGVTSVSSSRILNKEFTYSTEVQGDKYLVTYDMSATAASLPKEYKVIGASLQIQGTNSSATLVGSTSGTVSSLLVSTTAIPANLNFSLKIKSPDGDLELARTVAIQTLTNQQVGGTLGLIDFTAPTDSNLTQKEYNENLAGEVSVLKQAMDELKSLSIQSFDSRLAALEDTN